MNKVYNFSPGPSKINESVINKVKKSIENYKDTGKSIFEISHRSKDFEEILDVINQNFQKLFGFPNDFKFSSSRWSYFSKFINTNEYCKTKKL